MNRTLHTFVVLAYKESSYLEDCIKSVLDQKYKSNVVIATSTPNDYIRCIAKKYNLKVIVNNSKEKGIGKDFDFAIQTGKTELVTVAHQDDVYDYDYSYEIVKRYQKNKKQLIFFSNYYEIRNDKKVINNLNLKIKKMLLFPMKLIKQTKSKFIKRIILAFGDPICCPSVTFVKKNVVFPVFDFPYKCDVDWAAWENMSKQNGYFVYVPRYLMGHRIHEESTTTEIIHDNIRTKEDYQVLCKFWPKAIAKIIALIYKKSEKNNG